MPHTLAIHTCARAQADRERAEGYWDGPLVDKDPLPDPDRECVPWHRAPNGATHALWSHTTGWYFWFVDDTAGVSGHETVTFYWQGENAGWCPHKLQDQSQAKLHEAVTRPDSDNPYQPTKTRRTGMNLRNAALLVRDDIQTVKVRFLNGGVMENKEYTFLLPEFVSAAAGETVLVSCKHGYKPAVVEQVDDEPDIDPNSDICYKWIIANISLLEERVGQVNELTDLIEDKLKKQQTNNIRQQILRTFGIDSVSALLENKEETHD